MSNPDYRMIAIIPGGLMFRTPQPPGVPDFDTPRIRQVFMLRQSPTLEPIDAKERTALVDSLMGTLSRAQYHYLRFKELRAALDERRRAMPGAIMGDSLVDCLHFELQAFCGAARMTLDELVYLAARRQGQHPKQARRAPWETSDLVTKELPPVCDVPEIRRLRERASWFATLNAYRNSAFHHGWRHGAGHFSADDLRQAAKNAATNP
jgi:hypothetical protein